MTWLLARAYRQNSSSGKRMALVGAALALLIGAGTAGAIAQDESTEQCLDPEICPIPYVRLAKQETEPYLLDGKVVDESHPRYVHYGEPILRFPDVRSCLVESERGEPVPDLRLMDWDAAENLADVDVCVFRVASSIGDVDTVKLWLRYHGFHVGRDIPLHGKSYVPKSETDAMFIVDSLLPVEKFRGIFPRSRIWRLIGIETVHSYSLGIWFSQSGRVVGVTSNANIK